MRQSIASEVSPDQIKICLFMIVKNEVHVMHRASIACVSHLVDRFVIDDTGSTDGTQEYLRDHFKELGVKGKVFEEPWKNFAHNRTVNLNRAFDYIERGIKKGQIWYFLTMDADDYLFGGDHSTYFLPVPENQKTNLPEGRAPVDPHLLRQELAEELPDIVHLNMVYGDSVYERTCMARYDPELRWRYLGVVHEGLYKRLEHHDRAVKRIVSKNCFYVGRREGDRSKDLTAIFRDAQIMEMELYKGQIESIYPGDNGRYLTFRYIFYIGQSYLNCRYWGRAEEYIIRAAKTAYDQDHAYIAWLRGSLARQKKRETRGKVPITDAKVYQYYRKALNSSPERFEAPFYLSNLLIAEGKKEEAWEVVQGYLEREPVSTVPLFFDYNINHYVADFRFAILAHELGKYQESNLFLRKIMKRRNLALPQNFREGMRHYLRANTLMITQ